MTRRLIIIAEDGTPANFLIGVEHDYHSLIQFFKSKEEGAYTGKEMFCSTTVVLERYFKLQYSLILRVRVLIS